MRRGPQSNFVRDRNGNSVNGLRIQRAKNRSGRDIERFFTVDSEGRRKYFGNSDDRATAILRFRQWEAQQEGDTVAIRRKRLRHAEVDGGLEAALKHREIEVTIDEDGDIEVEELVGADVFWEAVRYHILSSPKLAAQKTGIEQLGYLHRLVPPPPSKSLEEIITLYLDDKKEELTPKEWKNSRTWWDEFCDITNAKFVADLDRDSIRHYRKIIRQRQKNRNRSPAWVRSRFGKIKTVINHALTVAAESTSPAVPTQQYHILAGHVAKGVDDNYIRRNPRIVEVACRAIERFYFGR